MIYGNWFCKICLTSQIGENFSELPAKIPPILDPNGVRSAIIRFPQPKRILKSKCQKIIARVKIYSCCLNE
jgi:hypothetical protein